MDRDGLADRGPADRGARRGDHRHRVQPVPRRRRRSSRSGTREDDDPLLREAVDAAGGVLRAATSRSSTSRSPRAAAPSSSGSGSSCALIALRRDRVVRRDRPPARQDQRRLARGRAGQRPQPDPDRDPVPPGDRRQRDPHRLRRRAAAQAAAARARAGRPVLSRRPAAWLGRMARQTEADPGTEASESEESVGTVLLAGTANLAIAIAKLVGGLVSGSTAMLAEAAHSFADTLNQVFLMAALKRSKKPADAQHPFGYGMERYFWSLLAAVGIFVLGAGYSIFEGIKAVLEPEELGSLTVAYVVLALELRVRGGLVAQGGPAAAAGRPTGAGAGLLRAPQGHARPDRQDGRLRGHGCADRHRAGRGRHHAAPRDRPRVTGTGSPRSRSACCWSAVAYSLGQQNKRALIGRGAAGGGAGRRSGDDRGVARASTAWSSCSRCGCRPSEVLVAARVDLDDDATRRRARAGGRGGRAAGARGPPRGAARVPRPDRRPGRGQQ